MKAQRQAAIVAAVRAHRIENQEQLRRVLRDQGIDVTQATLSRDMRELGLAKLSDPGGRPYYTAPPASDAVHPALSQLASALVLSVQGVGQFLVVKTPAGSANALASALDHQAWREVLGTIAGDDTILIITQNERARRTVVARVEALSGGGS